VTGLRFTYDPDAFDAEIIADRRRLAPARFGDKPVWAPPRVGMFDTSKCGTSSGARKHYHWGEKPCDACAAAHATRQRARRARQRIEQAARSMVTP